MPPKRRGLKTAPEAESDDETKSSMGSKIGSFFNKGLKTTQKQALEARRDLEHSLGLGHRPSVVPKGKPDINGDLRTIELGWHPVGGGAGKWFAEKTIIGKQITTRVGKYPDPTQHWAVIVGDYVHELWMDESLNVIYINELFKRDDWHTFEVGKTRFNDQALRKAGQMTIHNMREARPAYNLISNNCQNFACNLLEKVQIGAHKEFATAFEVYKRATGDGEVMDLWEDKHPEEQQNLDADEEAMPKPKRQNTLQVAQQVMDENTTTLDHGDGHDDDDDVDDDGKDDKVATST